MDREFDGKQRNKNVKRKERPKLDVKRRANGKSSNKSNNQFLESQTKPTSSEPSTNKWYEEFDAFNTSSDSIELKEEDLNTLRKRCERCFDAELPGFTKSNPSDAKWLETALHKGTAKDKANAGVLLVCTNPLPNLHILDTLITMCKISNKASLDVIQALTQLFTQTLLPAKRKLLPITSRGADWKHLEKQKSVTPDIQSRIMAYWHFEDKLRDSYFSFLQNLRTTLQTGQDVHKSKTIVHTARLLIFGPEKEQLLLSMLVNKLGDPSSKIASKTLHHLCEVANRHPNMCPVLTGETEKLIFRNNISEKAQHFALCFLAQIASKCSPEVCTKLVNICFAFFKVLVKKGAVNNKTMHAILRCLRKAVGSARESVGTNEIMDKESQDTIYRLVHLSDIHISIQTLCLLLQLISKQSDKTDRFYNALYLKMLDVNLTTIGSKTAAQFLHVVHQAIHLDENLCRAKAFLKRLLQISLYMPSHIACGCLIVVNKLLISKRELSDTVKSKQISVSSFDENSENGVANYNAYHRNPAYSRAEFLSDVEILLLEHHLHPTVKIFAETIVNRKFIDYYGDPLRDFSLTQFLERFCFKNPKKMSENAAVDSKNYMPRGTRARPVTSLTDANCTEDELYILNYMKQKQERKEAIARVNDKDDTESVDDDEFDNYLDSLNPKTKEEDNEEDADFDIDYINELKDDLYVGKKQSKQRASDDNEEAEGSDSSDAGIEMESDGYDEESEKENEDESEDEKIYESSDVDDVGTDSDEEPDFKKMKVGRSKTSFSTKDDIESLFVAADDFAAMLDDHTESQGPSKAVFLKDKSSDKLPPKQKKHKIKKLKRTLKN